MNLENGTIINQYKIISPIGRGGMGEVFLAEDTRLDRKVALKILPAEFAEDDDRMSRFVREAKSVSALNHPNIITIHEIGESNAMHFIATEFIDGKTLNDYSKTNPLDFRSILEIAIQVVSALDEAHAAGIVHRDIKPDNIMIRANGLVKILDFGIAKLSAPTATGEGEEAPTAIQAQTQAGIIIGTPNYMSPEQARGRDVDHQTDIFSFGVVLYELLSGSSPFKGETVSDVIAAVLTKEPPRLTNVPPELAEILDKTLQKDKLTRYQTAKDLLDDLKEVKQELEIQSRQKRTSPPNLEDPQTQILPAATTSGDNRPITSENLKSIAVLPFANMSADDENEYFCDGLAEELLNALSKIEDLKVAARTSAFSFKGKNANASEIGEKLGVKNVLEGSVRRSGDKLRISVQLINAANGFQLWSEKYDREIKDIFDIQDEIALAVVGALKLKLFGDERAIVLEHYTHNTEAYQLYLKGRYQANKFTREGFDKAIEYFNQALAQDPNFALVYVGMADAYYHAATFHLSPREAFLLLKDAATKALELDASLAEAHTLLALFTANYDRNLLDAEAGFKRGVELGQNNSVTHQYYGLFLAFTKRFDEGIKELQRAQNLDPLSLIVSFLLGWAYYFARQPEKLKEESRKSLEIEPNFWVTHWNLALSYEQTGQYTEALASLETARSLEDSPWISAVKARICARQKRPDEARKILDELTAKSNQKWVAPYMVATAYLSLDERDEAFEWLEKAFDECDEWIQCLTVDPALDALRSDSRFQTLVGRMGFPADKRNITDESLEAGTVMIRTGDATSDSAAKDLKTETAEPNPPANPKPEVQKPKSKWWLFGLLGLLALVGGLFGYNYFAPVNKQIESIAVMPFVNESGNQDAEYLSDGMTETLIKSLSNLPNLNVKPRSSVFRYKGKDTDLQTIAKDLNVQAVLSGRVVQRGDALTLSLELVDVQKNSVIWTEQYQRKTSELVFLQSEIARDVSTKLKSKLSGVDEAKVGKTYTTNSEAYQLYLKGRYHWNKRTYDDFLKAIENFKAATAKDDCFALAYSGLADTYSIFPYYQGSRSGDYMQQAKLYAERAVELDDQAAETHTSLAFVSEGTWNWSEAEKHYQRAIEINPNYSTAQMRYARFEIRVPNRGAQALARMKRALEIEPSSLVTNDNLSQIFLALGDADAALEQAKRTTNLDSQFAFGWVDLTYAQLKKGQYQDALASAAKAVEVSKRTSRSLVCLGVANAAAGRRGEAMAIVKEIEERYQNNQGDATEVAAVYAALGDKDQAFVWLDKAFADHSSLLVDLRAEYPFAALHDDPRYKDLLKRMNLPE